MRRLLLLALLVLPVALWAADTIRVKRGTNSPSALLPGEPAFCYRDKTFWVGDSGGIPVKVGVAGVADTNYVNAAVASYLPTNTVFGVTTNISVLTVSPTNFSTLYFTNGALQGVSTP